MKEDVLKIVMAGAGGVGKSALTLLYMYEEVIEDYEPTKADSYRKKITLDNETVQLDILDTAGQEEYVAVSENYFRTCGGALLVFDVCEPETLEKLKDYWETMCRVNNTDKPAVVVVANKIDKVDQIDPNALEAGSQFARSHGVPFVQTSARTNVNVEKAFMDIAREVRRRQLASVQVPKPARKKRSNKRCTVL